MRNLLIEIGDIGRSVGCGEGDEVQYAELLNKTIDFSTIFENALLCVSSNKFITAQPSLRAILLRVIHAKASWTDAAGELCASYMLVPTGEYREYSSRNTN